MTEFKNIYFDLDDTLWDVEANARDAFREIFDLHQLWNSITDFEKFIETFSVYNEQLWEKYRLARLKRRHSGRNLIEGTLNMH